MKKTTKTKSKKSTRCTGFKITYNRNGIPLAVRVVSDDGVVDIDDFEMLQIMKDWETHPDEDCTFPQKYVFSVEAQ
jgi:hypothetical protein